MNVYKNEKNKHQLIKYKNYKVKIKKKLWDPQHLDG